jgi:hypothetical protein
MSILSIDSHLLDFVMEEDGSYSPDPTPRHPVPLRIPQGGDGNCVQHIALLLSSLHLRNWRGICLHLEYLWDGMIARSPSMCLTHWSWDCCSLHAVPSSLCVYFVVRKSQALFGCKCGCGRRYVVWIRISKCGVPCHKKVAFNQIKWNV